MKLNALLDVGVVAHEAADEVAVLLDLEAPTAPKVDVQRPPATLQVVLDRSGSMWGAPLEGAKAALSALVQRLDPTDNFGLVAFDHQAQVVVPTGPLTDKEGAVERISSVTPGGSTDLSAGYLRALREIKRVGAAGATVLVISDGHVNAGIEDADEFAALAGRAHGRGVVTATLGYGEGYDETLLAAIARSGNGNHVFAADPDAAGAAIAKEVDGLLEKVVQAATLTVRMEPSVELLRLYNDLPATHLGEGVVMVELGDLYAGERRKLLLKLSVPAMAALGLAQVATIEVGYVALARLAEETVVVPIHVNVVPGDEAAQRIADPVVRSEVLFQDAQEHKRLASEAFEGGDVDAGERMLDQTMGLLGDAFDVAPDSAKPGIERELDEVAGLRRMTRSLGSSSISKITRASFHEQNRKRGRES